MAKINELLQENENLKREKATMVALLQENETLAANFKKVQYALLLCDTFDKISEDPLKFAETTFNLEKVALFIRENSFSFASDDLRGNERVFVVPSVSFEYTFLEQRPFYGKEPVVIHEKFRVYKTQNPYSFVVVPIVTDNKIIGAIGFYSADAERFDKEKNFDFLNELAFVAGIALKRMEDAYMLVKKNQNDYLTGLPNKISLDGEIHRRLECYKEFGTPFSFVILDIDNFSYLNETFGHKTADEALKRIGKVILKTVGDHGMAGRFGGDQFYLFLKADDEEKLASIIDNISKDIADMGAALDIEGQISLSGGGVRVPHDLRKAANMDELLMIAFGRLRKAKKEGRGTILGV